MTINIFTVYFVFVKLFDENKKVLFCLMKFKTVFVQGVFEMKLIIEIKLCTKYILKLRKYGQII